VNGTDEDFCSLIWNEQLYNKINLVPRVIFAPTLRNQRGSMFRTERYPQFVDETLQKKAAETIIERNVKTIVVIGGNGSFKGTKALCKFLPSHIRTFFIPVTIDSDVSETECIGEHKNKKNSFDKMTEKKNFKISKFLIKV
jgi:6-phosphofructokinase 1